MPPNPLPIIVLADLQRAPVWSLEWHLVSRVRIQPLVRTLILMVGGRGIAQLIITADHDIYYSPYFWFGTDLSWGFRLDLHCSCLLILAGVRCGDSHGLFIESVGIIRRQINSKNSYYSGIDEKNVS